MKSAIRADNDTNLDYRKELYEKLASEELADFDVLLNFSYLIS
jgi:hypothetical protein